MVTVTNLPKDGQPLSRGWSTTIPWMVKHHPHNGKTPSKGMLAYPPQDGQPFPRTVTHHIQDGQLDAEFDSSTAQLGFD